MSYLTTGQLATLACTLEVASPKPGNVHPGAEFDGLTLVDFLTSAVAIAPAMDAAANQSIGETVLQAIRATRHVTSTNTNLGTVLLLAPLCAVPRGEPLQTGVQRVLRQSNLQDAHNVYEAIRLAQPGGLGRVEQGDVSQAPTADLVSMMRLAASRDMVARQYNNGFDDVLGTVVPWLADGQAAGLSVADRVVLTHVRLMATHPDSLIARKCGDAVARESAERAASVLASGRPGDASYGRELRNFDAWLRADGHRRNPGTTADLIAAGLFAALRDGIIALPRPAPVM